MKIAMIAPPYESIPPGKYGGTERVVHALTEQLVALGHNVTLFASGDSQTSARLVATFPKGIRELYPRDMTTEDIAKRTMAFFEHLANAYRRAREFDIIHDHTSMRSLPVGLTLGQYSPTPVVHTLHSMLSSHNIPDHEKFTTPYLVSISDAQAKRAPHLNYIATVHNGLEMQHYPFGEKGEDYVLFVGRICREKGVSQAIALAKKLQRPLIIAAKLDDCDKPYFDTEVAPHLNGTTIRWIGEVSEDERNQLMAHAFCLLHPLTWEEPFGLTLIESMACGTPVAAFDKGSMREIIQHGKTGWIAKDQDIDSLATMIEQSGTLNRAYCRSYSLQYFNSRKMAKEYEAIYESIAAIQQLPYAWLA